VRYGYRRVHLLLRREGWCLGQNKTRRIYRELGQQLRNMEADKQTIQWIVCPTTARTPCEGQATRRSPNGNLIERDMGDGLRA